MAESKPSSVFPAILLLVGLGGCLVLCVPAGVIGLFFAFREDANNPGPGIGAGNGPNGGPRADITKASLKKIESGMSVEEINQAIGEGKLANDADMKRAFGEDGGFNLNASGRWLDIGRNAGVTSWRQWENGDESIFVGFAKGRRSGKDRAITHFWVKTKGGGVFDTEIGVLALFPVDDPDSLADEREQRNKLLNDPAFKVGDPKKLIVGVWLDETRTGYEFKADGNCTNIGPGGWNGTYRFVGNDRIDIIFPIGAAQPAVHSHKILVSQDTLILKMLPGEVPIFTHKRAK